jgi:hypothetical protein
MIFISGDVSEESENGVLLRKVIGPYWKVLTGADQPIYSWVLSWVQTPGVLAFCSLES